jgi:hypothetical protein
VKPCKVEAKSDDLPTSYKAVTADTPSATASKSDWPTGPIPAFRAQVRVNEGARPLSVRALSFPAVSHRP